jgi:pimeloyl-ACP methyl ester carboxylesterase
MVIDIRKGSGAFPLLRSFGSCETLTTREADGVPILRTLFRAGPQAAQPAKATEGSWSDIATVLAGKDGFFRESPDHSFLFIRRSDTLVVTFDNLDIAMGKREDRRPWGFSFIEKQGWSMLGVMANGWTWYRDPWVWQQFDALRDSGFFKQFKRVVFYGASMGGYAACAFVAACPGADVVAISPQSTLDKAIVPWETRYHTAWGRDFGGAYGDAAEVSAAAGRVFLLYDPYEPLDSGHANRFTGGNLVKLRAPLLGHRLGSSLQQMGILAPITLAALNGTLTEAEFYRSLRARKVFPRYQRELFKRALDRGRPDLARKLGRWVLTRGDNRYIRQGLLTL